MLTITYNFPPLTPPVVGGQITRAVSALVSNFGLNSIAIARANNNPYIGAFPIGPAEDDIIKTSDLGTPILSNLVIGAGSYVDANGVTQQWNDIELDTVILTVSQTKKIVETEIQGKDHEVKEYIGLKDYEIQLQGGIFGTQDAFPKDAVRALKKALASPQPLAFASWWLQNLDIDTVVVFTFDIPETEGEYASQYFTATVKSDVPVEVNITGN